MTSAKKFARLKTVVEHIGHRWPIALGRHVCLKEFGSNAQLHKLLSPSYAAHVHNMLLDVLMTDLIREIGAVVLDLDGRSASIAVALQLLGNYKVRASLERDYRAGVPTSFAGMEEHDEATRTWIRDAFAEKDLERNLKEYRDLGKL